MDHLKAIPAKAWEFLGMATASGLSFSVILDWISWLEKGLGLLILIPTLLWAWKRWKVAALDEQLKTRELSRLEALENSER